jgi:hypothetical protein
MCKQEVGFMSGGGCGYAGSGVSVVVVMFVVGKRTT